MIVGGVEVGIYGHPSRVSSTKFWGGNMINECAPSSLGDFLFLEIFTYKNKMFCCLILFNVLSLGENFPPVSHPTLSPLEPCLAFIMIKIILIILLYIPRGRGYLPVYNDG